LPDLQVAGKPSALVPRVDGVARAATHPVAALSIALETCHPHSATRRPPLKGPAKMSTANPVAAILHIPARRLMAASPCLHGIIRGVPENRIAPNSRHSCDDLRGLLDHVQVFDTGFGRDARVLVSSLYRYVDRDLLAAAEERFRLVSLVSDQGAGHTTLLLAQRDSAVAARFATAAN
jgi:hypothetical protein